MLRIRLLGELELELDGRPLQAPASRPARALLGWLALHPGMHAARQRRRRTVAGRARRERACEPAHDAARAARGARRRRRCRRLVATRDAVGLRGERVDRRARLRRARGGRAPRGGARARAGPASCSPASTTTGCSPRATCTARRSLDVLERLAARADEAGDGAGAVRWTREQVARDPLSEQRNRALMTRLAAAGDRSAALAVYDRLQRRACAASCARHRRRPRASWPSGCAGSMAGPARLRPGAQGPAAQRPRAGGGRAGRGRAGAASPAPRLRAPPAQRLRRARAGARAAARGARRLAGGERRLVALAGEPGIGKTPPARRVRRRGARRRRDRAARALPRGAARRPTSRSPRRCARSPPRCRAELTAGAPRRPTTRRAAGAGGCSRRRRAAARGSGGAACCSRSTTSTGPTGRRSRCSRTSSRSPRARRAARRRHAPHGEVERAHPLAAPLADLHRQELAERIDVRGLGDAQIRRAARGWLGAGSPRRARRDAARADRGQPVLRRGAAVAVRRVGVARTRAREASRTSSGGAWSALGRGANRVLAAAAVAGHQFDVDAARGPTRSRRRGRRWPRSRPPRAAQLVREEPGSPGLYAFAHALVRQTLYEELSAVRRARLHGALAAAIEAAPRATRSSAHLGELAHHHLAAATSAGSERAGGRRARRRARGGDAARLRGGRRVVRARARRAAGARRRRATRGETLLALGDARERAGERAAARDAFRAAAAARARARRRPSCSRGGARLQRPRRDDHRRRRRVRRAAARGARRGRRARTRPAARLVARLAVETYYGSTPEQRKALGDRAVALARASGDEGALHRRAQRAPRRAVERRVPRRAAAHGARRSSSSPSRAGDRERAIQGHNWLVLDHAERGDMDAMRREIARHEELADALRLPSYQWWGPMWRSTIAILEGRARRRRARSSRSSPRSARARRTPTPRCTPRSSGTRSRSRRSASPRSTTTCSSASSARPRRPPIAAGFAWIYAARGDARACARDARLGRRPTASRAFRTT